MKRATFFTVSVITILAVLLLAACGPSTVQPAADQSAAATLTAVARQQAIEAAVQATLTAVARQQAIEVAIQATLTAVAPALTPTLPPSATPVVPTFTPMPPPNATPVVATIASPADVPRITVQELKAKLDAGQAVVFDARRRKSYIQQHIAGAISLPQNEVTARLAELPTDKLAVFYCT